MATRAQAKAAVDNATAAFKADIDTLPSNVNIVEGRIEFGPTRYYLEMAEADNAAAESLTTAIVASRANAKVRREGSYVDDVGENVITIKAVPFIYVITGF